MGFKLFEKSHEIQFLKKLKKEERKFFIKELLEDKIRLSRFIFMVSLYIFMFLSFIIIISSDPPNLKNIEIYNDFEEFYFENLFFIFFILPIAFTIFLFVCDFIGIKNLFKTFQANKNFLRKKEPILFLPFSRDNILKRRINSYLKWIFLITILIMLIFTAVVRYSSQLSIINTFLFLLAIPLIFLILNNIIFLIYNMLKILDEKKVKFLFYGIGLYVIFTLIFICELITMKFFGFPSNNLHSLIYRYENIILFGFQYLTAYIMWWEGNQLLRFLVLLIFIISNIFLTKLNIKYFAKINSEGFNCSYKIKFKIFKTINEKIESILKKQPKIEWKTGAEVLNILNHIYLKRFKKLFILSIIIAVIIPLALSLWYDNFFITFMSCFMIFYFFYFSWIMIITQRVNSALKIEFYKLLPDEPKKIFYNLLKSDLILNLSLWTIVILPNFLLLNVSFSLIFVLLVFTFIIIIYFIFLSKFYFIKEMNKAYESMKFEKTPNAMVSSSSFNQSIMIIMILLIFITFVFYLNGDIVYFMSYFLIFFIVIILLSFLTLKDVLQKTFLKMKFKKFDKSRIIPFVVVIFYISIIFIPIPYNYSQDEISLDKEYLPIENVLKIEKHEIWKNKEKAIRENIIIEKHSTLEIVNSTIIFRKNDIILSVFVRNGGKLIIDNSTISSRFSENKDVWFEIYGEFYANNSIFKDMESIEIYSNDVSINNCKIIDSSRFGIYIGECSPKIKNCKVQDCKNYGIRIIRGNPIIENCEILNNEIGIVILEDSKPIIENCKIINNKETGVSILGSKPILKNNIISQNENGIFTSETRPTLENNTIKENEKKDYEIDDEFTLWEVINYLF